MFQLEAMLPLLILAFLGTPMVLTQDYHGPEVGKHSCTSAPEGKNITSIRVFLKGRLIVGIQFNYNDNKDGQVYGSTAGKEMVARVSKEEHIIAVQGTYTPSALTQIIFTTNQPRQLMVGYYVGSSEYSSFPDDPSHVLKGACVSWRAGGIKSILFLWGTENSSCVKYGHSG
uniref:Demilune cell and parotid protein 1 n=1 Tax=Mus musculus TaxID=10090 RepID=Q99JV1_MOUSE|nr:Demilune cell and parotid protein 1 [Mus musculus]